MWGSASFLAVGVGPSLSEWMLALPSSRRLVIFSGLGWPDPNPEMEGEKWPILHQEKEGPTPTRRKKTNPNTQERKGHGYHHIFSITILIITVLVHTNEHIFFKKIPRAEERRQELSLRVGVGPVAWDWSFLLGAGLESPFLGFALSFSE